MSKKEQEDWSNLYVLFVLLDEKKSFLEFALNIKQRGLFVQMVLFQKMSFLFKSLLYTFAPLIMEVFNLLTVHTI